MKLSGAFGSVEKMVKSRRGVIVRTSKGFEIEWSDAVSEK